MGRAARLVETLKLRSLKYRAPSTSYSIDTGDYDFIPSYVITTKADERLL